jgi:hypothetical protein
MRKWEFIQREVIALSIQGAFQRAGVYSPEASNNKRSTELGLRLASLLREFGDQYSRSVTGEQHKANIEKIADDLTEEIKGKGILYADRFRIGIAQKALNLYLKYLWCLGEAECPPHCPFDSRIIAKLPLTPQERKDLAWTKLDSITGYQTLVDAAVRCKPADCPSLSEWELELWKPSVDDGIGDAPKIP